VRPGRSIVLPDLRSCPDLQKTQGARARRRAASFNKYYIHNILYMERARGPERRWRTGRAKLSIFPNRR
jgi:hypothetical protein